MNLHSYVDIVNTRYQTGYSREHSYRGDLQTLISSIVTDVLVTNEPARIACGAPDYIITKNEIPVGYIEAKDIGVSLNSKVLKEQFDRYRASLDNLIITDYLDFHLYIDGEFKTSVKIAEVRDGQINPLPENFSILEGLLKDFCTHIGQTIKSSKKLAGMMAGKASMLADVIEKALNSDVENQENSTLKEQMNAFQQILIHDIKNREFADIYAQTIAYGMFAARLHDPTLPTFSRQEAAQLIPKTNPFLRTLFQYIAGYDLDSRIVWIVDGLADLFRATDIAALLKNFGKATQTHDPIIHFYETFLAEYDPKLRKARGVWYTPEPVVNFIVRAVDDILKADFNLPQGLADTSKTKVKLSIPTHDKRYKAGQREYEHEVHKVQILDPATGTGTFLAEVVKHIHGKYKSQQGIWSSYVENHLIPRLNGFELLMASYAMAHLKLDLLLAETGYKATKDQRFRIYLTNSLEEHHPDTGSLFATALANEANEANFVKRDTPIMTIIGNPPYSGESTNKGKWIMDLMEDYKKEPEGKTKLNERNPKWLNDDYVKFIRYGQHFIEQNGEGVLAFINPHGFLDNPTFRGMRWNLLKTYDKIYTIDLHGNSKKKEVSPDGSADVNVFDIQQGVSINLFIKTGKKKVGELGKVYHYDLFGKRDFKYSFLLENNLESIDFKVLENIAPNYFFLQKDFASQKKYDEGFLINDLLIQNNVGIVTAKDAILIDRSRDTLIGKVESFFKIKADTSKIKRIAYRPFDVQHIYFDVKLIERAREKTMQHFLNGENVGLNWIRPMSSKYEFSIFISNTVTDQCSAGNKSAGAGISYLAPLYLYPNSSDQISMHEHVNRIPNLKKEIVNQFAENLGLDFTTEKNNTSTSFAPIDVIDYIYALLHSPSYREKYKEFLKIDFPRVPYPTDADVFWSLVALGSKLRQIHLLESPLVEDYITSYPKDGNNVVDKPWYENGNVYINDSQYFANVPQAAWEFYIGGYQPAQKWLKDRKGGELTFDDILHYQKIIIALIETNKLMQEVDEVFSAKSTVATTV